MDFIPVAGFVHLVLQPRRVVAQVVFLETFPGNGLSGSFVGDNEGEDGEAEEEQDEEEHDGEVDPEEPCEAAAGAQEASEGDEEDEEAQDDDRPLQEAEAIGGMLGGEPDTDSQDGDADERSEEVEDANEVVAETHDEGVLRIAAGEVRRRRSSNSDQLAIKRNDRD